LELHLLHYTKFVGVAAVGLG